MKKAFLFMAAALTLAAFSCKKPANGTDEQNPGAQVTVAAENLVAYFPLESAEKAVTVGEGITFDSKKGAGDFGDGRIGKAYTNTKKMNIEEAYLKFNLAKNNAFTKLESMTFSAWVYVPTPLANPSNPSEKLTAKGAILSFNGTGVEPAWPSFVYLLDNEGVNEETGKAWMQFNGRVDFLSVEGKPNMWPNASDEAYAAKDKWIHVARTYDATTGAWVTYANGLKTFEGLFTPKNDGKDPVLNFLRASNLLNGRDDKVKIVYHPDFINTTNPLFRMEYNQFVRGCHLGLFPSYYEPWGYTPLECMASGVPSVTSDFSGFGAYVQSNFDDCEKMGIYIVNREINYFDAAEQLANIMLRFVKLNRRDRISMRNNVEENSFAFDWSKLAEYYFQAYEEAAKR